MPENAGGLWHNTTSAPEMTAQTSQTLYDSQEEYSESEYSTDDDATTGVANGQPTTALDTDPGAPETRSETDNADLNIQDDSGIRSPLVDRLLKLEKSINSGLLEAVGMAQAENPSHKEAYNERLREAQDSNKRINSRKKYYKKGWRLSEEQNVSLLKEVDDWKSRTNMLQGEIKAAQDRAKNLFG